MSWLREPDGEMIIMHRLHRWFWVGAVAAGLAGTTALVAWRYLDARHSRKRQIYEAMSRECHPVWRDLDAGRIRAGQAVEAVILRTHPVRVEHFENVTFLHYHPGGFTGLTITAKDGRLVSACAGSCTWDWTFFDTWPADEWAAFSRRYAEHHERIWNAAEAAEQLLQRTGAAFRFLRITWSQEWNRQVS